MKAGREHRVPLSTRAREVLLEARELQGIEDNQAADGLVFFNPKGKPYSDMVFTQLMRRMGLEYTMHGFRAPSALGAWKPFNTQTTCWSLR